MKAKGSRSSFPTVFDTWAKEDEKRMFTPSLRQLTADAFTFHGAGTDTTAHTLTMGTWFLINDEACLDKLRDELSTAIPEPNSEALVSSVSLEHLPYLVSSACNILSAC
jgi:cytochrome P450